MFYWALPSLHFFTMPWGPKTYGVTPRDSLSSAFRFDLVDGEAQAREWITEKSEVGVFIHPVPSQGGCLGLAKSLNLNSSCLGDPLHSNAFFWVLEILFLCLFRPRDAYFCNHLLLEWDPLYNPLPTVR